MPCIITPSVVAKSQTSNDKEVSVNSRMLPMPCWVLAMAAMFVTIAPSQAQENAAMALASVRMTVTVMVVNDKRMPDVSQADVLVKQGKDKLKVTAWVPAQGDNAGLDLFILIDDACDTSLGSQLDDLRSFINA
jgi:hypothetical protein